jgi:hypothetical protein
MYQAQTAGAASAITSISAAQITNYSYPVNGRR